VLCAAAGRLADLAVGVHAGELVALGGEQAVAQPQVLSSWRDVTHWTAWYSPGLAWAHAG
jgi:hypothetical protein